MNTTAERWDHLVWFQVQTEGHTTDNYMTPVFRNGRQTVPITILLDARNAAGEQITLTPQELSSLTLIDYDTGDLISHVEEKGVYDHYSDYANNFAPAGSIDIPAPPPPQGILARTAATLYITTTSTNTRRIGASIKTPNGSVTFTTNTYSAEPGGMPTNGKFNSSISVRTVPVLRHTMEEFGMDRIDGMGNDYFDVDYYRIFFLDKRFSIRASKHHSPAVENQYHYVWWKDHRCKFQIAYSAGPTRNVRFEAHWLHIDFDINTPAGTATAARIIDKIASEQFCGSDHKSVQMTYTDNFGNEPDPFWLNNSTDGNFIQFGKYEENSIPE